MDSLRRMPPPLHAVVLTQFLSAFADNLNFFLIVGMVKRQGVANPDIMVDYIQIGFLGPYIILAPIVGAFADKNAKSSVLLLGNILKAIGLIRFLLFGLPTAICYILRYWCSGLAARKIRHSLAVYRN